MHQRRATTVSTISVCAGSTGSPRRGITRCAPAFGASLSKDLRRLIPWVHCEAERAPMNGQERAAAEQRQRLQRIVRPEVNVAPGGMERADLEHDEIERPEPFADRPIFRCEARVAAEEDRVPPRANHERGPQGRVPILDGTPRKVLRRRRGHAKAGIRQRIGFPPVKLDDALGPHAPGFEMRADAERRHERHSRFGECADGRVVEMIVVIVRYDDDVDGRHSRSGTGTGWKRLGPKKPRRRRAGSPHRIGEHAKAVDFDQQRRVAEPGGAQSA